MQRYHEKAMLGETQTLDDIENSMVSTILVHSAHDGFEGAGHHLRRHNSAFVTKDTGVNTKAVTESSEVVIAQNVLADRIPVAGVKLVPWSRQQYVCERWGKSLCTMSITSIEPETAQNFCEKCVSKHGKPFVVRKTTKRLVDDSNLGSSHLNGFGREKLVGESVAGELFDLGGLIIDFEKHIDEKCVGRIVDNVSEERKSDGVPRSHIPISAYLHN